jgi:hypothetical protein
MSKKGKKQAQKLSYARKPKPLMPSKLVIISSTVFAVLVAVVIVTNKRAVEQSVQGVAIVKGMFAEATITFPQIPGASAYNIYYGDSVPFTHAVRKIPASMATYTIQYLKKGVNYQYKISAVDIQGKEIWFSQVTPMRDIQGM